MEMQISKRYTARVLFSGEAQDLGALVREARIRGVSLREADFSGANLSSARLDGADFYGSDFSGANLFGVDFRRSNLLGTNFYGANLYGSAFDGADLSEADLRGANLWEVTFDGADLRGAYLPSPAMVLSANWGDLSDQLTADLMLLDSLSHPNPEAFEDWADGGPCPYSGLKIQRVAHFAEQPRLWGAGRTDTMYNLMVRVLREKTKTDL